MFKIAIITSQTIKKIKVSFTIQTQVFLNPDFTHQSQIPFITTIILTQNQNLNPLLYNRTLIMKKISNKMKN